MSLFASSLFNQPQFHGGLGHAVNPFFPSRRIMSRWLDHHTPRLSLFDDNFSAFDPFDTGALERELRSLTHTFDHTHGLHRLLDEAFHPQQLSALDLLRDSLSNLDAPITLPFSLVPGRRSRIAGDQEPKQTQKDSTNKNREITNFFNSAATHEGFGKNVKGEFELSIRVPNAKKEDIEISLDEKRRVITININPATIPSPTQKSDDKGKEKEQKSPTDSKSKSQSKPASQPITQQQQPGRFQRSFFVPRLARMGELKANFENGVLKIVVPLGAEGDVKPNTKQIPVSGSDSIASAPTPAPTPATTPTHNERRRVLPEHAKRKILSFLGCNDLNKKRERIKKNKFAPTTVEMDDIAQSVKHLFEPELFWDVRVEPAQRKRLTKKPENRTKPTNIFTELEDLAESMRRQLDTLFNLSFPSFKTIKNNTRTAPTTPKKTNKPKPPRRIPIRDPPGTRTKFSPEVDELNAYAHSVRNLFDSLGPFWKREKVKFAPVSGTLSGTGKGGEHGQAAGRRVPIKKRVRFAPTLEDMEDTVQSARNLFEPELFWDIKVRPTKKRQNKHVIPIKAHIHHHNPLHVRFPATTKKKRVSKSKNSHNKKHKNLAV